jgi:hypothetical protein
LLTFLTTTPRPFEVQDHDLPVLFSHATWIKELGNRFVRGKRVNHGDAQISPKAHATVCEPLPPNKHSAEIEKGDALAQENGQKFQPQEVIDPIGNAHIAGMEGDR